MREIDVYHAGRLLRTESFVYPGGEIAVRLPGFGRWIEGDVAVVARLQSAESILQLDFLAEILSRCHAEGRRTLAVPYFPYARQDRVTARGEAFTLRRVGYHVSSMGFDRVQLFDPHSDVTPVFFHCPDIVDQAALVSSHPAADVLLMRGAVVVAPDAGAAKKAHKVASAYHAALAVAAKVRDTATGEISGVTLQNPGVVDGQECLIVDDICDGGRTFVELAKVLREAGAASVHLYVTHGIFSKGLGVFAGLIDTVLTTDTYDSPYLGEDRPVPLHVMRVNFDEKGALLAR